MIFDEIFNKVVFLFCLQDGIKRFEVENYQNDQVLKLCEKLCDCKFDSIKEMLNSSDETVIGLGLKTLAELDYKKYYNTAIHLLCTSSGRWGRNKIRQNTSVKYMLKTLDLWRWVNERYSKETTQEDFDMLKQVLHEDFKSYVEDFRRSFTNKYPFANVEFSYDFNISAKLGEIKEVDISEEDD